MLTIVHGSDLHFGTPHDAGAASAFLESILRIGPDLLVLSGDFTQRAKVREFQEARAWLDGLPPALPRVVTPGNHDVPLYRVLERLFAPFRNYREWIHPDLDTVTRIPGATVVSLNSAAPRRAIVNGRLDLPQLALARRAFGEAGDDARIVVVHHHLAPAPDYERDSPLPGAPGILEAFEAMGVDLVLSGHLHRAYIGNSLDVYQGEDRERGVVVVQSGTTTSRRGRARERAKQSFNMVRLSRDRMEVVHYMLFEAAEGFAPFSAHVFPRHPRHWFAGDPLREAGTTEPPPEGAGP
jgi:3',5'-cyclic AMP phosphodiesterase CpdA